LADVVADAGRGFAPRAAAASAIGGHALAVTQKDYWERFFETDDPWNYTSPYEQEKYERTLSLLPAKAIDRALELACAEGHFTIQLAGRVGSLIAADISERALARARARCEGFSNVAFQQNDLSTDALPQGLDLIVCSEVLYFLKDESELRSVARRMAEALAPDGCLLTAHAFLLQDDLDRTGFDWESAAYGAATISQVLQETEGLVLEQSIVTDLYRIDQLRRRPVETPATPPRVQEMAVEAPIAPEVERHLIRGGARILRAEVRRTETTERLPILMYHSVATGGSDRLQRYRLAPELFEAQMRWLRANGYHAVTSTEVFAHFAGRRPFRGRPVWLTFDDGLRDFHDFAWPILQRCDFSAENFVVTDLVGGTAGWESDAAHDLPLMDWAQISSLSRAGIRFGSHLASHRYADSLSSRALVEEAVRSRLTLEDRLDTDVFALAAPYGTLDERLWRIAGASGYRLCLSTRPGVARLGDSIMDLPRIEIAGSCDLAAFAAILESAR
jgi:peptidoglycan/xylan/chitin deacetylase (PgdA/CDA1 family)/2-polyprenyl-3-methyl-5-hydroxy-6-metoxy-1,4-benzoquinol methylase